MHTINNEPFEYATTKSGLIAQVRQLAEERAELMKLCEQALTTLNDLKVTCEEWMARAVEAEARL